MGSRDDDAHGQSRTRNLRGGRRWLLKSPQHLEQLPVLAEVFPGATVLVTHRDPAHVVTSLATMVSYIERMFCNAPLDPQATGQRSADRLGEMLDALLRDRDVLGPDTSIDLRFDEFIADQEGALERVLALAGEELFLTVDPDLEPLRWSLTDPQRQTLWGQPAPKSWFEEGTVFANIAIREPVLEARPVVAR